MKDIKSSSIYLNSGAFLTMLSVIPVISIAVELINLFGLINLVNVALGLPLENLTAEISIILSSNGFRPVVSKSREIKLFKFV